MLSNFFGLFAIQLVVADIGHNIKSVLEFRNNTYSSVKSPVAQSSIQIMILNYSPFWNWFQLLFACFCMIQSET